MIEQENHLIILIDLGSEYLDISNKKVKGQDIIILDRHQPEIDQNTYSLHANPALFNIDSVRDTSGAEITYLTPKDLLNKNFDFACIGVIGALGDLQDKYSGYSQVELIFFW